MPVRFALLASRRLVYRIGLLAGVSAVAVAMASLPACAGGPAGIWNPSTAANIAAATSAAASQQAAALAQQSQASMTTATNAIRSILSAQAAARAAAQMVPSSIPNGLTPGGLVVDPRVTAGSGPNLWVNANLPVQTTSNGETLVTVKQTAQRAVATWQQFNVGRNTTVYFDQSLGNATTGNSWVVLNRIDATGVPSQIEGQIKAEGTVLLINPNGIVFNGTSQVNVHTLIAAAADINSFSGFGATNVGAFSASGNAYVPIAINGTGLTTAGGTPVLAPSAEDNANVAFVNNGLFANPWRGVGNVLALSVGTVPNQTNQGIVVQNGASITTNISGFDNGGVVALVGPSVVNAGTITVGSGQIIMAAGVTNLLVEPTNGGTALSVNPSSGSIYNVPILVYYPPAMSGPAVTQNDGLLTANDGNITLYGDLVNQNGVALATTSVSRAGSFDVLANQQLTFGASSVTAILPHENGATILGNSASSFVGPSISIVAPNVDLQGTASGGPGALIVAPSAAMTISTGASLTPGYAPSPTGRFFMESGSVIDLSGLAATASVSDYLYTFKVTSNDVADSPLAQSLIGQTVTINLALSGVRSDGIAWVGSPLFSASGAGYLGDIPKTIDQLLTKGGTLSFPSISTVQPFQDVLQQAGSTINISGGSITYSSAQVNTTKLVGADGAIYDIGSANPFVGYVGVVGQFTVDHAHWGVVDTYLSSLLAQGYYQQGYIDGISAGGLSVAAVNPVLEGTLVGAVLTGSRQAQLAESDTGANGTQAIPDQLPVGAALSVTAIASGYGVSDAILLQRQSGTILGPNFSFGSTFNLPTVTIAAQLNGSGVQTQTIPELVFSTDVLTAAQFGSITIRSSSFLSEAQGAVLSVRPGGSITLAGVSTIDGTLSAPAGKINLTGFTGGAYYFDLPPTQQLTIGPDAVLNVAGLWVNDAGATDAAIQGPAYINGGSITIQTYIESTATSDTFGTNSLGQYVLLSPVIDTTQSILLARGSVVDVSSGGYVDINGKLKTSAGGLPAGNGGSLSLLTYQSSSGNTSSGWEYLYQPYGSGFLPGNVAPDYGNQPNQANIFLDGTIYAGGLATGGTLALQAPAIQIGGVSAVTAYTSGAQAGTLALPASFFASNGFSAYSLTSTYGSVTVAAGTTVMLQQQNYLLGAAPLPASGIPVRDFALLGEAPVGLRQPVSLSLTEIGYSYAFASPSNPTPDNASLNAGILIDTGAAIVADPGAQIALTANGPVTVLGSLRAPGGSIALTNNGVSQNVTSTINNGGNVQGNTSAPLDIWIGSTAVLDVGGVFVPTPYTVYQNMPYKTGTVLPGGSITLSGGTVVAMPGSQFDLGGASATIGVPSPAGGLGGPRILTRAAWSNGGSLTISGDPTNGGAYQAAFFDGTINAAGGGQGAGGALTIAGSDYYSYTPQFTSYVSAIIVSQSDSATAAFNNSALDTPGAAYPTTAAQLAALLPQTNNNIQNYSYIAADRLNNSGLASVSLSADRIAFSGNVTLKLPGTIALAGVVTALPAGNTNPAYTAPSIGATVVNVDAGYITLSNVTVSNNANVSAPSLSDATINFNASAQIDVIGRDPNSNAGTIAIANAANVNLTSGGDIRLLGQLLYVISSGQTPIEQVPGILEVPDNLTLTAREIYASSDSAFLLQSLGSGSGPGTINTITIASNGKAPVKPYSVDGQIIVDAPTIVQGGALFAPLGTITLGLGAGQSIPPLWQSANGAVATQSVTLAAGSLTSVSLAGLDLPYGTTVSGASWTAANSTLALTAPPAKSITLNGATIASQSGAVVDLSGGGSIYATEFVPGTGGSRNALTSASSGQTVYALVPSYEAPIAPVDLTYGQAIAPGSAVTLAGGNGIAAGTYVLLPGIYATLPGAYRVVVVANNVVPRASSLTTPDGSIYMTGTLTNTITGATSSQTALLQIQSNAVWSKYSEIDVTPASSYFPKLAASNKTVTPQVPIDAGVLTINAGASLTLQGSFDFAPAAGGRGGLAAISGTNLLVLAPDQTETAADAAAGYIVLNSSQLDAIGAAALLIGGTFSQGANGYQINPTANAVVVSTDSAHPLTAPDLLLVAAPTATATNIAVDDPHYGTTEQVLTAAQTASIDVRPGSVIQAVGDASAVPALSLGQNVAALPSTVKESAIWADWPSGNPLTTFYTEAYSGALAALLQVSNGAAAVVQRGAVTQPLPTVTTIDDYYNNSQNYYSQQGYPQSPPYVIALPALAPVGSINIGASTTISGATLSVDGGNVSFASSSTISAKNVTLSAQTINLGSAPVSAAGLIITPSLAGQLAGSQSVTLQSATVINLYGTLQFGATSAPIGTLTFDAAGLYSDGGAATIIANNVDLVDSQTAANTSGALNAAGGSLSITVADTITLGAGAKTLGNFSTIGLAAGQQIVFVASGSLSAGGANVTLQSPDVAAALGSSQSLTTTGLLAIEQGVGTAPQRAATDIGGALSLTGGSVTDGGTLTALAGSVSLVATSGDVLLTSGAMINAGGSHIVLFDATEDAPGGTVRLVSTYGNVTIDSGAAINVSATGSGFAGTLAISAPSGVATLDGTLSGGAAYNDLGGNFSLSARSLSGSLPLANGFTSTFAVALQQGDIVIAPGQTLSAGQVTLAADGGNVIVDGTIDASGPTGGLLQLYGGTSVTIGSTAQLLATYRADSPSDPAYGNGESTLVQTGGTIVLGTTGAPNGTTNSTYGYENVDSSGAITVASGAILDVSGGIGGANINNAGGEIIIRAPLLTSGNVNVSFRGNVVTSGNGGPSGTGLVLNAYAVWSTTDSSTGGQHFDGIIDPAGWFDNSGNPLAGYDQNGFAVTAPTPQNPLPTGEIFTPFVANSDHITFYQTTLVGFTQTPFANASQVAADFAGATGLGLGSTLHLRPEIDLVNPTPVSGAASINGGNITVASNWNLGAGTESGTGVPTLYYRTINSIDPGEPGTLVLRALNNVQINATISDGFFQTYQAVTMPTVNPGNISVPAYIAPGQFVEGNAIAAYQAELSSSTYRDYSNWLSNFFGPTDYLFLGSNYSYYFTYTSVFSNILNPSQIGSSILQPPAVFSSGSQQVIDQYNQFYVAYVNVFDVYAGLQAHIEDRAAFAPASSFSAISQLTDLPPFQPTAATAGSYATQGSGYLWQYAAYLVDAAALNQNSNAGSIGSLSGQALPQVLTSLQSLANQDGCVAAASCIGYVAPFAPYYAPGASTVTVNGQSYPSGDASQLPAVQSGYVATQEVSYQLPPTIVPPVGNLPSLQSPATAAQVAAAAAAADDAIANNPGYDGVLNVQYNTTSSSNLMPLGFGGSQGSFSYDFVAGAVSGAPSVNPNALAALPAGTVTSGLNPSASITISGHTSYFSGNLVRLGNEGYYPAAYQTIDIPTLLRTGTGSITLTAAGSFELLDTVAPGAVYTAGAAAPLAANYTAPVMQITQAYVNNGLVNTPSWGVNGGAVTITVQDAIIGVEAPTDATGSQTLIAGAPTGEFWTAWYYRAGLSSGEALLPFDANYVAPGISTPYGDLYNQVAALQNAAWINYATFFQGIGALGGGNVTLKAGGSIYDISASLPETIQVSGGQYAGGPQVAAHYYGGGDLIVQAGGNIYSSAFYVGRGTGSITAGGMIAADPLNPVTGTATAYYDVVGSGTLRNLASLPLLLAEQDGFISLQAAGSIELGGVFDPTELPQNLGPLAAASGVGVTQPTIGATFQTYGPNSGIALTSIAGDVALYTLRGFNYGGTSLFASNMAGAQSPPIFDAPLAPAVVDVAALTGSINLASNLSQISAPSGTISFLAGGSVADFLIDYNPYGGGYYEAIYGLTMLDATSPPAPSLLGVAAPAVLSAAVHADDPTSVIIYAGGDITGNFTLIKPAKIQAVGDIVNTTLVAENNHAGDITSVIAGGSILAQQTIVPNQSPIDHVSSFQLYGPGTFLIQAGGNLGPFFSGTASPTGGYFTGIATLGDGSNLGSSYTKPYLPIQGADVYALFGVGPGIDYAAAIADYINPAMAGTGGINFLNYIATSLGQSPDQAWATFKALPAVQQRLLIDQAFLDFLPQVNLDYNDPASAYYHQYARAYETIATLFPASFGYTNNVPTGTSGAAATVTTGNLSMAHSLLETQTGGSIYLIGPGGNIAVGANATDNSQPNQEGILTLQGGSILSYTDQSVEIYQSRIFTEQGGNIDMFSANGDLNAGKGPKSSASYPPLTLIWDADGYSRVNPSGLVTGAGIGALLSIPGQDPTKSNVVLTAPHGTVDAGAAGIRVAGNLNIVALQVLNSFNIQVGGTAIGVPTTTTPNIGALTSANNTAAAVQTAAPPPTHHEENASTSVIIVEVIGYGGGSEPDAGQQPIPTNTDVKKHRDGEETP